MKQHALRVSDELWEDIEIARGRLSRNAYIVAVLDGSIPRPPVVTGGVRVKHEVSIDDWGGVGKRPPHPKRSKR